MAKTFLRFAACSGLAGVLCLGPLLWASPRACAPPARAPLGISIVCKPLGLQFKSPKGWRLAQESSPEQLLLFGHAKKSTPLMRIQLHTGRLSAMDRLPVLQRSLPPGEAQVKFVSAETWDHSGQRFQTVRATAKIDGSEYVALLTLVDQPGKLQHSFWVYGRAKDVDKQWPALQASIATAKGIASTLPTKKTKQKRGAKPKQPPVWMDDATGLTLGRWPAGFALDPASEKKLSSSGLVLKPTDDRAHDATVFRVSTFSAEGADAGKKASAALKAELEAKSNVGALREITLRVAGIPANMLRWTENHPGGPFLHETYLVQKASTVTRIDFIAVEAWARVRSRRNLIKDFVAGIRL